MALTASPSGFIPRKHPTGQSRATAYTIDAGYTTAIGYGDAVTLNTNGTVTVGAATADLLGVFAGCEYVDASVKPNESMYWPGTAGATKIVAYVYDAPENVYEVQVAASGTGYVQTAIGAQADMVAGTVNTSTGRSAQALAASLEAGGAQGQFRVVGFGPDGIYDASTNTYPTVLVQIAQHVFVASKVSV